MKLSPTQILAPFAIRISSGSRARRRSLNAVLPAAADLVLEPRLVLDGGGSGMDNMPPMLTVDVAPIPDTAVNGDVVGYATAEDVDGDTIMFAFEDGSQDGSQIDPSGTFAIDENTGVITIANADNIGSQDENDDSPAGWSFTATVFASDGINIPTFAGVWIQVMKSQYQVTSPENGEALKVGAELVVEATRAKGVRVRAQILMKINGEFVKPPIEGAITDRVAPGTPGKTKATFEFGPGTAGEFRLDYSFKLSNGDWIKVSETFFTVTP